MIRSFLVLAVLLASVSPSAFGQERTILISGQRVEIPDEITPEALEEILAELRTSGAEVGEVEYGVPIDQDEVVAPVDPNFLQLFQQLALDRRPSTILAEWSKPDPTPADEDPELKDPADPEPIGEPPTAPKAPTAPVEPVKPVAPADVVAPVDGLGSFLSLIEAKAKVAEGYAEAKAAYDASLAAYETELAAFTAAEADFETKKTAYDLEKAAYDKRKAQFDKSVAQVAQAKAQNAMKRAQREIEIFSRNVTLGRWEAVGETLAKFGPAAKAQYAQVLNKIARSPQPMNGTLARYQEEPAFEFDDIVEIIAIAPEGFENKQAAMVAPLVRRVFAQGHSLDDWTVRLRAETSRSDDERVVSKRLAALLLTAQGYNRELGEFLPPMEEMVAENDPEGLNLLARHCLAEHDETPTADLLGKAWEATMAVLAPTEVDKTQKTEALKRAVDLVGRVRDAKGEAWLRDTFTERPERGMEVLAVIGAETSKGMAQSSFSPTSREENLRLLKSAVDALLEIAPERAAEWGQTLTLVADTWLREARHSFETSQQTSMGPSYQRDPYGNIYWYDDYSYNYNYNRVVVQPVEPSDLLEIRPDGAWRAALPASLRPKIDQTIAELYLKVAEEGKAFPYIADLAPANPKKANELAKTFIEVWLNNNDPNSARNKTSIYNFSYGFNQRASGIPLTRSRQDRNLRELAKWVGALRGVEGIELDSDLLVRAFTQCHSQAEVYRVEVMEQVFGDLDQLDPETLAAMTQRMRSNLGGLWRIPDVQRDASTNRKQKEIEAEVQRGYQVAQELLARAIEAHPESWQLQVSRGAMLHDLNNYRNEIQKSSDFSGDRREALDVLRGATLAYIDRVDGMRIDEYSIDAFTTWFNAALGASDLAAIDEKTLLARSEIDSIKSLLDGLEGEAGEKHRSMFANMIFTRLSSVNPAIKNRYLEAGFDIVGDHPQAREARRVYEYYQDLVTEIELAVSLDGSSDVGTEPFGLHVDLRYTKEIGRESGGFGKYLQNQANAVNAYYNYGRPQENYRDKFEEAARTLLDEQFEVVSVTFNREKAASKADAEDGWQRTSYAYILLRAKSEGVDRVPPLKIDLDFNDVTGYVVLPITSPVVPIDASAERDPRPYSALSITQILDERRSDEGVLNVEVKAQAEGLVPDLEAIVDLTAADFEVTKVEGGDIGVARFADSEDAVVSERLWTLELRPKEGVVSPETFAFLAPRDEAVVPLYQRYDDADLVTAGPVVDLRAVYDGGRSVAWWWWALIAAGVALVTWVAWRITTSGPDGEADAAGPRVPTDLTPVTVLGLLGDLRRSPSVDEARRRELDAAVIQIEEHYFGTRSTTEPDLGAIVGRFTPLLR